MLVGPDAPLVVRQDTRVSHFAHAWDFYKPDLMSEYPTVDGKLSIQCYLEAIDKNYTNYINKQQRFQQGKVANGESSNNSQLTLATTADFYCFHSPFTKLVKKSFARMLFNDFLNNPENPEYSQIKDSLAGKTRESTYFDRDVEKVFMGLSNDLFSEKVEPSLLLAKELGNTYTASLYCGLVSLLSNKGAELAGKKACLFSYGSGFASSLFSIEFNQPQAQVYNHFADLNENLKQRTFVEGKVFDSAMKLREETHHLAPYSPASPLENLNSGTYYCKNIDDKHRRSYAV
eukprot:Pgem_evm1s1237